MSLIDHYYRFRVWTIDTMDKSQPYFRQFFRFLALPYCFFKMVDWKACPKTRLQVAADFAYLFFVLKHFPANYSKHQLWKVDRKQWATYFGSIYDPWQRFAINKEITPKDYQILTSDKGVWHMLARSLDIPAPEYFGEFENNNAFRDYLTSLFESQPEIKLVIKPSKGGGGRGVVIASMSNQEITITDAMNNAIPLSDFILNAPYIIEQRIDQHPTINQLYPYSANSIRYITVMSKSKHVHEIGAMIKFGIDGSLIDNRSRGGIAVCIDIETGVLQGSGISMQGMNFHKHPDTGIQFDGFQLPCWDSIRKVARQTQEKFTFQKFLGQDIALTSDGPVILELNNHPDTLGFEQVCGPLFKNKRTWEIFKEWDILISKPVRHLY